MGKSYRRRVSGPERRKAFSRSQQGLASLWQRAPCCGATVAADPGRMGARWADVHEAGCGVPWQRLGLGGEPREVYPGAPYLPDGAYLRAVNRQPGQPPGYPVFTAAARSPR